MCARVVESVEKGKPSRRGFIKGTLAAGAGLAIGAAASRAVRGGAADENVILVIADAMRADKIGRKALGREVTPNLNRFARECVAFSAAFACAPWTKTSMASILSGRLPPYHGVETASHTLPAIPTIPGFLRTRGLHSFAVQTNPFLEGERAPGGSGRARAGYGFNEPFDVYRYEEIEGRRRAEGSGLAYALADQVIASFRLLLETQMPALGLGGPFFAYLHFMETHQPWLLDRPTAFTGVFHDAELAEGLDAQGVFERDWDVLDRVLYGHAEATEADRRVLEAINDEAAACFDSWFAVLLEYLAASRLLERTTIIFTADHGDELCEHGCVGHENNLFNTSLAVPLMIRRPGLAPARIDRRVPNAAIFATLREWFGAEGDAEDGLMPSLMDYARDGRLDDWPIYANLRGSGKAIVPGGAEAMERPGAETLFFDIEADPGEEHPLPEDDRTGAALGEMARIENACRFAASGDRVAPALSTHPWQISKGERDGGRSDIDDDALSPEDRRRLRALGYLQ